MKKASIIFIIFMLVLCLCLTSCSAIIDKIGSFIVDKIGENVEKNRNERKERLLAVQGKGGHIFVYKNYYVKDDESFSFRESLIRKMSDDGIDNLLGRGSYDNYASVRNEFAYFAFESECKKLDDETLQADVVFGYINMQTDDCKYFIAKITVSSNHFRRIKFHPAKANDNYYFFQQSDSAPANPYYYVIDVKNNCLIENTLDTPYIDGTEYKNAAVPADVGNYDYVLERSQEMQQIDAIIGQRSQETRCNIVTFQNRIYVVFESALGMFGKGELLPVVFEYISKTDSFEYIGCSKYSYADNYVRRVIPCLEN